MEENEALFYLGRGYAMKGYSEEAAEVVLEQTMFAHSKDRDFFCLGFLEGSFKER